MIWYFPGDFYILLLTFFFNFKEDKKNYVKIHAKKNHKTQPKPQQHIIKKQKSDFSLATLNNLRKKSKYWSEKPGKGSGNE